VKLAGVVPLVGGAMLSQEFPEVTAALTLVAMAGLVVMFNCWVPGAVVPMV
jgi:hypothetical protein